MIFYGHGVLFLGKKRIRFEKKEGVDIYDLGTYETDDKVICDKMLSLGYKSKGEAPKKKAPKKETKSKEVKDAK